MAILRHVDDSWNATVRVDVEEPLLFLLVLEELDGTNLYMISSMSVLQVRVWSHPRASVTKEREAEIGDVRCIASLTLRAQLRF